jgi:hypothetical protein
MSKTLETDKAWNINQDAPHSRKGDPWALASRLERERDELRERVEELVATLDEVLNDWQYGLTDSQAESYQIARDLIAKTKEAK